MSLDFSLTKVDNWKALDPRWTEVMVFECMAIGMTAITEKNKEEWKMRSDFYRHLHRDSTRIEMEMVERYVGLSTNVSTETWAHFSKRHIESWKRTKLAMLRNPRPPFWTLEGRTIHRNGQPLVSISRAESDEHISPAEVDSTARIIVARLNQ